ncbi:MAG: mechanosensitive ion channel family protein, partial [Duncaniella sp.]|nr:mechanosensitive ion channel family protein [Duncaniella sp.]
MKRLCVSLLILAGLISCAIPSHAQLIKRAEQLIQTALNESRADSAAANADTLTATERYRRDSVRLVEMEQKLQEMKLNEILLRTELDNAVNGNHAADSLRLAEQTRRIDSLRAVTPGVPVIIEGDTLFMLYAERGGYSARARADMVADNLTRIGSGRTSSRDSLHTLDNGWYIDIMYGDKVIVSLTDTDALWQGTTRQELAEMYMPLLAGKINDLRDSYSFWQIVKRAVLF